MSLNGLDAEELTEAYQSALKEGGGWFLLQYKSRDEVGLLGKGNGGIGEIHELVDHYEEASPLFGFIHYRRRKIVLKYVPEEISRLLQARLSVHFQSITEWLTPYDAVFTFSKSVELSDSALLSSCSLHAAASSKSSNDPNALRGLAGISEDVTEGQQNGKQPKFQVEESDKRGTSPPPLGGDVDGDEDEENHVHRIGGAKQEPGRGHQRSRTLSNANKNLPPTPNHPTSKHANSSTAFESGDFETRPSFEARLSTQSERPSAREINRAYEYKHKVKLGPRPSIDLVSRQDAPGMGRDTVRPKATLPAGLRMPTRKPAPGPVKAHPSSTSHPERPQAHLPKLPNPPPPLMTSLSDGNNLFTNYESNVVAASLDLKPPKMTPEKKRLMKALQIRQKHIEAQNAAKGLGISIGHGEENAQEIAETDGSSPLIPKSTDVPENKLLETEQITHRAQDIQDSPCSVQETSEGLSTRASSIHDEEVSSTHKQDPLPESKENESSKVSREEGLNLDVDTEHLAEDNHAHYSKGRNVHEKDKDDAREPLQSSELPLTLSIPSAPEETISDDRKPALQAGQRLSGLSSSTVETIVRQPHAVLSTLPSDGGNIIHSPTTTDSQRTSSVHVENAESPTTSVSNKLAVEHEKPDSPQADGTSSMQNFTPSALGESSSVPRKHSSLENTAADATRHSMTKEDTSEHLEPKSSSDPSSKPLNHAETLQADNSSDQKPSTGTAPEFGLLLGGDKVSSDTQSLNSDALATAGPDTFRITDGIRKMESQESQDIPKQATLILKIQEHEADGEREHTEQSLHTATRSFLLPRSPSLSSEEQDEPQPSQISLEAWNTATSPSSDKQTDNAPESTTEDLLSQGSEGLIQNSSQVQGFGGPSDLTERKARRRGLVNPIHKSVSEQSEEQFLSDDSFMEELKSAKVEEAKPISVSKSPIKPVFSKSESDYRVGEGLKTSRNISSPLDYRKMDDATATSPPRPAPLTIRSFSAVSQPKFEASSPITGQVPQAKKTGVSSGISQRIKALEKLSSRPNSPITPSSSTPSFLNFPKSTFLSGSGSSDINTGFAGRHRPSTASASPVSSPDSAKPNPFSQAFSPPAESISVTATIVREPEKRSDSTISGSKPPNLNLYQSPLKVERQSKESAPRQVMGPPPPPTPRSPVKSPRPKYSRYSSARSVDSASTDHKGESSQATRRSSFASKRSLSSRNGSDVDLPRSMSEKSLSSNGLNGIHEEKKESRSSRLLKRMSSVTSASRRSIAQAISPNRKTEAISEQQEPVQSSRASTYVDLGDVNVQFPDNLLWKRRHLVIDESGVLLLSASLSDKKTKVISKSYMLSEFRPPYIPDQDREELPNSVVLDFNDGSTLQCACEHASEQAHLLKVLNQLYSMHCRV